VLAIHYCRQDERTKRFTTERLPVAIGRAAGNDLVLADPGVSDRHCRLSERDGAWIIDDLGSARGTLVNGRRITAPVELGEHDRIFIGPFVLELEEIDGRLTPVEQGLLDGIARGDDHSRTIYADWLEERGDVAHAEFLRVQQSIIDDPIDTPAQKAAFLARSKRLRELAASVDLEWRMRVARPAVEGCRVAFEIPCKMDWGMLEPTDRPEIRKCNTCRKEVRYCSSEDDALQHAERGQCIVVDVRQVTAVHLKSPYERPTTVSVGRMVASARGMAAPIAYTARPLATQVCGSCRAQNPAAFRFCATCGAHLAS